nr:polysaccharide lyase [uncultured Actinoplanes sp.]
MTSMRGCCTGAVAALALFLTAGCGGAALPPTGDLTDDVTHEVAWAPPAPPAPARTTLDWETARQQSVPRAAPPGWSGEYAPGLVHVDSGQPQVRIARVPEPVRAGGASARFELVRGDPVINHNTRAELATPIEPRDAERWYAFSVYLPADWARDRSPEILAQFHQHYGIGGEPPLAIGTRAGQWELQTARDAHSDTARVGAYRTGGWTDWLVHARWSARGDGLLQIWRDGVPVPGFSGLRGPNTYRSRYGVYLKVGLYKWDWSQHNPTDTTRRVMYLDELRIADTRAGVAVPGPPAPVGYGAPPAAPVR